MGRSQKPPHRDVDPQVFDAVVLVGVTEMDEGNQELVLRQIIVNGSKGTLPTNCEEIVLEGVDLDNGDREGD